ncbi:MAG: NAD(P)/FAD-dependent oxidoreductase [Acutalibacteraceae bacterium]
MKKIIVAGGGHGGIGVASILASRGYDVTVYEKCGEGKLGYDWTDIFAPKAFDDICMPMPPEDKYEYKENMTFYGPSLKTALRQDIPEDKLEIKMERRDIYDHIISNAVSNGAKFVYDCEVLSPIMAGNRVVGINTSKGEFYGDLIIDACGLNSPVRNGLPSMCNINPKVGENNKFYVYRVFYNKASDEEVKDKFKVFMYPEGKLGIGWVAAEENHTDMLIGRFEPFDLKEVEKTADYLRKTNHALGTEILRGGQFVQIPVRQPLSRLVCDGYAAIGDSAYMTVPIIGSGIANSFKAARILSDVIEADTDGAYSSRTLCDYQVGYYQKLGNGFAVLACIKEALTVLTPGELDYFFDNGVITAEDMSIDSDTTTLGDIFSGGSFEDLKTKVIMVVRDPAILKKMIRVIKKAAAIVAVTTAMPKEYSPKAFDKWVENYEKAIQLSIKS